MKSSFGFLAVALISVAACSSSSSSVQTGPAPMMAEYSVAQSSPKPDPREGLKPGVFDAGVATWNMRLVSTTPPPAAFLDANGHAYTNSDLGFVGNYAIQGNYNGFMIWDISN